MRCEDYPCCGHTPDDPCGRQWYDEPGAFDTSIPGNAHALCEHEYGICEVEEEEYDEYGDDEPDAPFVMEDQWLDGSYEE